MGVSVGMIMPLSTGLLAYYFPPEKQAGLMGLSAALYLGQFLSPLIVTPLGALCFGADDLLSPFKAGVIIGVVYLLQAWLTRKKQVVE